MQNLTKEFAEAYHIEEESGVIVGDVFSGSAAERAGLQRVDVIISVNNEAIKDVQWFVNKVRSQSPGATLRLKVIRGGKSTTVTAKLDEIPDSEGTAASSEPEEGTFEKLGIAVSKLTNELKRQYKIESRTGLVVVEVADGSAAQAAGIQEGDLLREVNGKKVNDAGDLRGAVRRGNKSVVFLIEREGRTFFAALKLQP